MVGQGVLEAIQPHLRIVRLRGIREDDEHVDVVKRTRLGVAIVGPGQKVARNGEAIPEHVADLLAAADRVVLLLLGDLEPGPELLELIIDAWHQRVLV